MLLYPCQTHCVYLNNLLLALLALLAESQECQTMILAASLVQTTNPRCRRLHRALDEGMVHRDAITARQERPKSVYGTPIRPFGGLRGPLDDGGGMAFCETQKLAQPSTAARGMSFVMQSTTIEAVTTRLGSHKAPGDKQGHCGCAQKHKALVERWMCRSTQHISD